MSVRFVSPCVGCPPLPFIDARGGVIKGNKVNVTVLAVGTSSRVSLSVRAPLARRCPSGRIEEEPHYVVVGVAVWLGGAVHLRRLALPPSSLVLTQPA
jgi:hypothetical protein